jgi:hypothetical protein
LSGVLRDLQPSAWKDDWHIRSKLSDHGTRTERAEFFKQFRNRLVASRAYCDDDVKQAVLKARCPMWAGALSVLSDLRSAVRARPFIDLDSGVIDFKGMTRELSFAMDAEQLLIAVASSLWTSKKRVDLAILATFLDADWLDCVVTGLRAFQQRPMGAPLTSPRRRRYRSPRQWHVRSTVLIDASFDNAFDAAIGQCLSEGEYRCPGQANREGRQHKRERTGNRTAHCTNVVAWTQVVRR